MPDLGHKHACFSCDAKFYDLGRPEAICPKCGANQKDAKKSETAAEAPPVRRRRREEVVRVEPANADAPEGDSDGDKDDSGDDDLVRPEGIDDSDVVADDDKDDADDADDDDDDD